MGIRDCIRDANKRGDITKSEADDLDARYNSIVREVRSEPLARKLLNEELGAEAIEARRRARLTETARVQVEKDLFAYKNTSGVSDPGEALMWMMEHKGHAKFQDVEHLRLAILGLAHAKLEDLLYEFRKGAVTGEFRRLKGVTKARLDNVVKELHGSDSGDALAKELAQAWSEVTEALRQRFNAAGGAIRKLDGWGLPQAHDPEAMLKMGRDNWVRFTFPLLDRQKMTHGLTGRRLSDDELVEALNNVFNRTTTDGWIDREPSMSRQGKGALFRQHQEARFLHFKDGDAWLRYQNEFGEQDIFGAMMQHISVMTRDIAFMQRLGPNPEAMFTYASQIVEKRAATGKNLKTIRAEHVAHIGELTRRMGVTGGEVGDKITKIEGIVSQLDKLRKRAGREKTDIKIDALTGKYFDIQGELARLGEKRLLKGVDQDPNAIREFDDYMRTLIDDPKAIAGKKPTSHAQVKIKRATEMWNHMRGSANSPVSTKWANVMGATRNIVTSAILGSASITALSDAGFGMLVRNFNGLNNSRLDQVFKGIIRQLTPSLVNGKITLKARREAVRSGLILDGALHSMYSQARYMGTISGPRWSRYLADRQLTFSGLTPFTQGGKHSHGMEVQATLADNVGKRFDELDDDLSAMLERHGFTPDDWNILRKTELHEPRSGVFFLRPNEIEKLHGAGLAEKYLSMILRQMTQATPEQSIRARTLLVSDQQPGTVQGEALRTFGQLKAFPVESSMLMNQSIFREIAGGSSVRGIEYASGMLIVGTLMGAVSMQLHEISNGRDPRPTDDVKFWMNALMRFGGLGIYGDFLFADRNKHGGSLAETIAGPVVTRVNNLSKLTIGNLQELSQGKKTNAGRELVSFARQNTPILSSLWWAKMAYQRVAMDQMQYLLDPNAHKSFRRRQKNQKRAYGNEYWWRPGRNTPDRGPKILAE